MLAPRYRWYVVAIVGIFLVLPGIWAGLRLIPASRGYSVRAEFADLPTNDRAIEQWLCNQPGVVAHTAKVLREGRVLYVIWIMTQNVGGNPQTPDLRAAWKRMGYLNPKSVDWDWRGGVKGQEPGEGDTSRVRNAGRE